MRIIQGISSIYKEIKQKPFLPFLFSIFKRKLLLASIRSNRTGHFYWIGSDSWGAKLYPVRDIEYAAVNSITVLPHSTSVKGFDKYYRSLRPKSLVNDSIVCQEGNANQYRNGEQINCRNIWFNEFWSQHHQCTFETNGNGKNGNHNNLSMCTGQEILRNYEQEGLVPFVGE